MAREYSYEKLDDQGNIKYLPINDPNGEITGKHIMNLEAWMNENPEERKRLGWIKHIHHDIKEVDYDKQTQYLQRYAEWIDPYTIEDKYIILDKAEEIMLLEEMLETTEYGHITIGGFDFGG